MALFDRENGKLVVRVVYDGPGNAGKTTNLQEICKFFTGRRRSELVSPEERNGRTMWFDWVQVDGGLVAGYGLRCQIVTVPGQLILRRRRTAILTSADVVVLVCDSTPDGLQRVRPAFGRVRQFVSDHAGRDVPLVLQANKQDLPDAVSPDHIAERLGADASIPVVGARACEGAGVRETLVLAIRAAANRVQQLVLEKGIDALAGVPDDAESILAELRRLDGLQGDQLDELLALPGFAEPDAGVAPILGAIETAISVDTDRPALPSEVTAPPPAAAAVRPPTTPPAAEPGVVITREPDSPQADTARHRLPAMKPLPPIPSLKPPAPSAAASTAASASTIDTSWGEDLEVPSLPPPPAPPSDTPAGWPLPPLDATRIAPGNIWPAATGRELMRPLALARPRPRMDLVNRPGTEDGSGKPTTIIYEASGWCLKTSTARRFADLDAARAFLVDLARTKVALGSLTLVGTVLAIDTDADNHHWVWTIAPWRTTLRAAMAAAAEASDVRGLAAALVAFASAAVETSNRGLHHGQGIDLHPSNFALDGDTLVYLDDDVEPAPPVLGLGHAILQRAEEYAKIPLAITAYAEALCDSLVRTLTLEQATRVGLVPALRTASPRTRAAQSLCTRLLDAIDGRDDDSVDGAPPANLVAAVHAAREVEAAAATRTSSPDTPVPATGAPDRLDETLVVSDLFETASSSAAVTQRLSVTQVLAVHAAVAEFEMRADATSATDEPTPAADRSQAPGDATEPSPPATTGWPVPPRVADELPSGFIWPVVGGRELVRRLSERTPRPRGDAPFTYDLGDYTISTTPERRFLEVDDGRAELVRLARAHVARGPGATAVLVLAPDPEGAGHWIWTFAPAGAESCASP